MLELSQCRLLALEDFQHHHLALFRHLASLPLPLTNNLISPLDILLCSLPTIPRNSKVKVIHIPTRLHILLAKPNTVSIFNHLCEKET
jgi:hypothetical protein